MERTPTLTDIHTFHQLLKSHDWYFEMTDDHSVWLKGKDEQRAIHAFAVDHPELIGMLNDARSGKLAPVIAYELEVPFTC